MFLGSTSGTESFQSYFREVAIYYGAFCSPTARPVWIHTADGIVFLRALHRRPDFLRAPQSTPHWNNIFDKSVAAMQIVFDWDKAMRHSVVSIFCALRNRRMLYRYGMVPYLLHGRYGTYDSALYLACGVWSDRLE